MKMICFGSSSAGNCYYIELERKGGKPPVKLILEVGLPYKETVRKASINQIDLSTVDCAIVTHEHTDHARSVKDFKKRGIKVFANKFINEGDIKTSLEPGKTKVIAVDTTIVPFKVEHDANEPLGFVISTGLETILFVNDCKYFKADLSHIKFDYIMIEANYDGQVLHYALENAKKDNDYINIKRYERISNSHMSLKNCIKLLQKMDLSNCKSIFLMHLSDKNARSYKFKTAVENATNVKTYVCKKYGGLE